MSFTNSIQERISINKHWRFKTAFYSLKSLKFQTVKSKFKFLKKLKNSFNSKTKFSLRFFKFRACKFKEISKIPYKNLNIFCDHSFIKSSSETLTFALLVEFRSISLLSLFKTFLATS